MITLHNGSETIELLTDDNSYSYEAVMGEDALTLYFSHPGYLNVPVGSWCEFYGKRYSLKKDSNLKKNGERNYSYTLILETSKADTELWKIRNTVDNRIKFPYTAKPKEHLKLIVDNLNRRSSGWVIGDCIDGTEKLINYNHTVCLDALNQLAETYETEYQITETVIDGVHTKTVHLKKVEYNKDNPLTLSYGKGHGFKNGVGRESGEIPPEIILVETTDRNIDYSKYGAKELLMPKSQSIRYDGTHFEGEEGFNADIARTYKTDEYGTAVMRADRELSTAKEDSLDCTEIYPSRVGTIGNVVTVDTEKHFYDFYDNDIPNNLNFEDCLIEGEKMTVIFQSGMLSGKEFEVKYTHAGRKFEIVPQEIDGITMPDGNIWMPKVGDKYAVFGIQLPEAYISDNATRTGASWDVFREAAKYLYEHEDKKFTFNGTLDGIWAKKRWLQVGGKIILGGFVNFTDTQFHPEGSLIRIVGIKRYVNNPYSPEIELSNTPVGTSVAGELNKIETDRVTVEENHKKAQQFTKRYFRDAQETLSMLADSLLNFSGSINPITVATMQMLVGDESLQYRFVNSKTNPVAVVHNITYSRSTKVLNVPSGIIQHMTLGITEIKNNHSASEYKFWDMAEYNSPSLVEPEKKFYLYAKCSKDNQSGTFFLSETAVGLEQIDGYYHLLVGILNSENDGERSFATLYGFTEILPGRITTDKIVSSDGNTYFDLLNSEIGGRIKFRSGSSGLKSLDEWEGVSNDISNAQASADNAQETADSALTNAINALFNINSLQGSLGSLAYKNLVSLAVLDETIIEGGFIKTALINAKAIVTAALLADLIKTTELIAEKFNLKYGSVGDFDVSSSLKAKSGYDEMLLSSSLIRFTNQYVSTFIGADTVPATAGGSMIAPIRINANRSLSSYSAGANTCLHLSVEGAKGYDDYVQTGNHALYIPKGDICGFRLRTRRITTSQTLSLMDSIIIAIAKDITISLPYDSSVEDGQMYFIRNHTNGVIYIKSKISSLNYPTNAVTTVSLYNGDLATMIFDKVNNIWVANNWGKW